MSQDQQRSNGAAHAPVNPLGKAIEDHAKALLECNKLPNGQIAINPGQLFLDQALAEVRIEILFEALVEAGVLNAPDMMDRLRAKLEAEIAEMQRPQLAIAPASILDR